MSKSNINVIAPSSYLPRHSFTELTQETQLLPLLEYASIINASYDLSFIATTLLNTLMGKFLITRGMFLLKDINSTYRVVISKGVHPPQSQVQVQLNDSNRFIIELKKNRHRKIYKYFFDCELEYLFPLTTANETIGIVALGRRYSKQQSFSGVEKKLLHAIITLSATVVGKARIIEQLNSVNRTLGRKVQELNTLFELSKEFSRGIDAHQVIRLLTFALMGQLGIQQYIICLLKNNSLSVVESKGMKTEFNNSVIDSLKNIDKPIYVDHLLKDRKHKSTAAYLLQQGFQIIVPLQHQNKIFGLLLLGNPIRHRRYETEDFEFLVSLGTLATIALENRRLMEEMIEKQIIEDELKIAREIQQGLYPSEIPQPEGVNICALSLPTKEVGGDYYDVIQHSDDKLVIAIGDVSGKGMPAALLMANVQAAFRTLMLSSYSIKKSIEQINSVICSNIRSGTKFITFFACLFDTKKKQLVYSNAGHNPPFIVHRNGRITKLTEGGLILGVFPQVEYDEQVVQLADGDVVVFYTDGISEAMNAKEEEFTEERLEEIVLKNRRKSAEEIVKAIQKALSLHVTTAHQSDDITLVVMKVY